MVSEWGGVSPQWPTRLWFDGCWSSDAGRCSLAPPTSNDQSLDCKADQSQCYPERGITPAQGCLWWVHCYHCNSCFKETVFVTISSFLSSYSNTSTARCYWTEKRAFQNKLKLNKTKLWKFFEKTTMSCILLYRVQFQCCHFLPICPPWSMLPWQWPWSTSAGERWRSHFSHPLALGAN